MTEISQDDQRFFVLISPPYRGMIEYWLTILDEILSEYVSLSMSMDRLVEMMVPFFRISRWLTQ